jgi:hypothetical protein
MPVTGALMCTVYPATEELVRGGRCSWPRLAGNQVAPPQRDHDPGKAKFRALGEIQRDLVSRRVSAATPTDTTSWDSH